MFKMLPIFLGVAIIGGCVAIFFLREKRKSAAHSDPSLQDKADIPPLTEKPKPLRSLAFHKDKTDAKQSQLEQIKKSTTVV
jgi:hypothetical protein